MGDIQGSDEVGGALFAADSLIEYQPFKHIQE
jgi:hypothetical protein